MILRKAGIGHSAYVKHIGGDERIRKHLCSLGCYIGERITVISILSDNYLISVKDSRFAIDKRMAEMIELEE